MTKPAQGRGRDRGGDDVVRAYLDEVGEHSLLTAAEEIELARLIEAGRQAEAELARGDPSATGASRTALRRTIAAGAEARERFIHANLRLVVSVARRYQGTGLALPDLIQEGNLGLMRAVEKFDHRKGFKFSTYATWWIRQGITRAIADKSRTIRVPAHIGDTRLVLARTGAQLLERLGREPTIEELSRTTGIPCERVADVLHAVTDTVSLSAPVGDDDTELGDLLADASAENPYEAAAAALEAVGLRQLLRRLSDRERTVVVLRFGLGGAPPLTLDDVARHFSLTRERIRQIEAKALTKLRHPSLPGHLRLPA